MRITRRYLTRIRNKLVEGAEQHRQASAATAHPLLGRLRAILLRQRDDSAHEWSDLTSRWDSQVASGSPAIRRRDDRMAAGLFSAGLIALLFELAVAPLVAVLVFSGPAAPKISAGVLLAVLMAWLAKLVWRGTFDRRLPRLSAVHRLRILALLGGVAFCLATLFVVARLTSYAALGFSIAAGPLNVVLPVLAGGCFFLAEVFRERNELARQHRRLVELLDDVDDLLKLTSGFPVGDFHHVSSTSEPPPLRHPARGVVAGLALLALLTSPAAAPSALAGAAVNTTLRLYVDVSPSVDPEESMRAVRLSILAATESAFRRIELYGFAGPPTIGRGPFLVLDLPAAPTSSCSYSNHGLAQFLRVEEERVAALCRRERQTQDTAHTAAVSDLVGLAIHHLSAVRARHVSGQQTCLHAAVEAAQGAMDPSILVTDGANRACTLTSPGHGSTRPVIVLLVRPNSTSDLSTWSQDAQETHRHFPTATIVLLQDLGGPTSLELGALRPPNTSAKLEP